MYLKIFNSTTSSGGLFSAKGYNKKKCEFPSSHLIINHIIMRIIINILDKIDIIWYNVYVLNFNLNFCVKGNSNDISFYTQSQVWP